MPREATLKGRLGDLQRLKARLSANSADLQHLEAARSRFEELLAQAEEAAARQANHRASKQEATKQFQAIFADVERLANILRLGVKQHYGIRSEKLAEFGLQPFRGRRRRGTLTPPAPEPPAAEAPGETGTDAKSAAPAEPKA